MNVNQPHSPSIPRQISATVLCLITAFAAQAVSAEDNSAPASLVVQRIDESIADHWHKTQTPVSPVASDRTFVRRVYLDLVGRIPTTQECETFLTDRRSDRRELLVDRLLRSEDYVQHFADVFDVMLMGRADRRKYDARIKHGWRSWLETVFRENRPWNTVVAEMLLARPSTAEQSGTVWFLYERKNDHQAIAESIAPAVFGVRIECAQCHDHMLADELEQRHYWGLVAFFNRSENKNTSNGPRVAESAVGGFSEFANLTGASSPNLLTFLDSEVVDESRPSADAKQEDRDDLYVPAALKNDPRVPRFSRRDKFVREVVVDHPRIPRAFVNRIWAQLLGRGIVHPFDEMNSVHPPSHPELLDWLAQDFQSSGYDIRRLIQAIASSKAYGLESTPQRGADDPASFAWYLQRPLTAEQLARSIQISVRGEFRNDAPIVQQLREAFPQVMPREFVTGVTDALYLSNNAEFHQFLKSQTAAPKSLVTRALKSDSPSESVDLLFETILNRPADMDERTRFQEYVDHDSTDEAERIKRLENAVWALITTAEFRFNH